MTQNFKTNGTHLLCIKISRRQRTHSQAMTSQKTLCQHESHLTAKEAMENKIKNKQTVQKKSPVF
jgi:hypothetical protein